MEQNTREEQGSVLPPPKTQTLRRRIAGGAIWLSIEAFGIQGFTLLIILIISRFLDAYSLGMISIALVIIQGIKTLFIDNITVAVIRETEPSSIDYNTAFITTVIASVALFLALILAAPAIENLLGMNGLAATLRQLSPMVILTALFRVQEGWLLRQYQFKQLAIRSLICVVVGGITGVSLAIDDNGISALIVQQLTMSSLSVIILWSSCSWRPNLSLSLATLDRIKAYTWKSFVGAVLSTLSQNADVLLVGYFFGIASAGVYSLAKRLRSAIQVGIMTVLQNLSLPILVELQSDVGKLQKVALTVSKITVLITAPVFLGLSATSTYVIDIGFGARWIDAAPVLAGLAVGGFCMAFISSNDTLLTTKNRPEFQSAIAGLYVIMALLLFAFKDPLHITNASLPFVLPYAVTVPVSLLITARLIAVPVSEWLRAVLPPLFASILMYVTVQWTGTLSIPGASLGKLLVLVVVGVVSFASYYSLFEPKEIRDLYRVFLRTAPVVWGRVQGLFKAA